MTKTQSVLFELRKRSSSLVKAMMKDQVWIQIKMTVAKEMGDEMTRLSFTFHHHPKWSILGHFCIESQSQSSMKFHHIFFLA